MSQQGGRTRAACCARERRDVLGWNVVIVWPGLDQNIFTCFFFLAFVCACLLSRSAINEREVGFAINLEIRDRALVE